MTTQTQTITALQKSIEDEQTGASSSYHVLDSYYVTKAASYTQATFATYVSKKTFDAGKQPVARSITIQVNQLPPKSDIEQWLYTLAAAEPTEGTQNPSALASATPVYEIQQPA
ncbi:MAG: hypothetical protein Q4G42_05120 [Neisseria sp.]|nr:hypothetical protein [Neisseria sp.]